VGPGLTRAAAHSVPSTLAHSNFSMVAPPGSALRIASSEQSAPEPVEVLVGPLVVGPLVAGLLGVSALVSEEVDPQAARAKTSPTTGTTTRRRTTRLL
jgi:hypothetical protein